MIEKEYVIRTAEALKKVCSSRDGVGCCNCSMKYECDKYIGLDIPKTRSVEYLAMLIFDKHK